MKKKEVTLGRLFGWKYYLSDFRGNWIIYREEEINSVEYKYWS